MNKDVKINNLYFISWNNCYGILLCLFLMPGFSSCKKYLELEPEEDMALPSTLKDCQALLDNYSIMNTNYPIGDQYADDYYLTFDNWKNQYEINRDGYIWKSDGDTPSEMWMLAYQKVLYANEVL